MSRIWIPIVAAAVVLAGAASAAEHGLQLDPAASRVEFTLKSTLHTVDGRMSLSRGVIRFDPATGTASGEIALNARRTETGNHERDEKMHDRVLESELFPEIVFIPERITGEIPESGDGQIGLEGTVTVHGTDHRIALTARITREGDHVHAVATLPVPYVAWGMKDPSVLVLRVAKQVNVALDIEATLSP